MTIAMAYLRPSMPKLKYTDERIAQVTTTSAAATRARLMDHLPFAAAIKPLRNAPDLP